MPESEARALLVALQETNLLSVASEPNTNLAATLLDEPVQESRVSATGLTHYCIQWQAQVHAV